MLVIVPGPARSGIASGKIAISSGPLSSFSADCNAGRCPKSIGSAVTNSRMPPLIENACTETPRKASALCPATRKKSEIMKPSATARVASRLRSRAGRFRASEMKIGSTPNGSTTTSRVANAVRPNFSVASSMANRSYICPIITLDLRLFQSSQGVARPNSM